VVEAEREFVEIILKMVPADRSLVGFEQPLLQERKDRMDAWQQVGSACFPILPARRLQKSP
jgi:hypothetical protein